MSDHGYSPYYADPSSDLVVAGEDGGSAMVPAGYYDGAQGAPVGYYPLGMQAPGAPPAMAQQEGILSRKIGPLPTWGWLVLLAGGAAAYVGYQWWQKREKGLARNDASSEDWKPSRGRFAATLEGLLAQKKMRSVKVFADADDAFAAGIKNPSPLVNLRVPRGIRLLQSPDFIELVRSEGLEAVELDGATIGLVPASGSLRGERWEAYIEALREEGQKV